MNRLTLALAVAILGSGCFHVKYVTDATPQAAPVSEEWHHDVVSGLIEVTAPVDVGLLCPRGFAVVENEVSFINAVAGGLVQGVVTQAVTRLRPADPFAPNTTATLATNGAGLAFQIWSPSTVRVTCAAK